MPADASRMDYPILKSLIDRSCNDGTRVTSRFPRTVAPSHSTSPFPALEDWILHTLGRREGLIGSIGTWSIVGNSRPLPRTVCFNMKNNRYCGNVGRAHKSNNISWNVNLADRVCWQGCHDPECRGYRGDPIDLPDDVNVEIDGFLLEFELSSLSENAVVEMQSTQQTYLDGDGEFDDVLLENAMRQLDISSICQGRDRENTSFLDTGLRDVEVDTSAIYSAKNELAANTDTSLIEYPHEDICHIEKKENPTAHDGNGEFESDLLENEMRQFDISSICQGRDRENASFLDTGLRNVEVDTSAINSVKNEFSAKTDTSLIESPNEDICRIEKKENQTAHDGNGEFDNDALLDDAIRQLNLSSICKKKESVKKQPET